MASQGIIKQLYICLTPKVCLTRLISTPKTVSNTATPKRWCSSNASNTTSQQRQKVVILGTGWGSYSVLKNVNKKLFDVIVVSPRNHFLFKQPPCWLAHHRHILEFRYVPTCSLYSTRGWGLFEQVIVVSPNNHNVKQFTSTSWLAHRRPHT